MGDARPGPGRVKAIAVASGAWPLPTRHRREDPAKCFRRPGPRKADDKWLLPFGSRVCPSRRARREHCRPQPRARAGVPRGAFVPRATVAGSVQVEKGGSHSSGGDFATNQCNPWLKFIDPGRECRLEALLMNTSTPSPEGRPVRRTPPQRIRWPGRALVPGLRSAPLPRANRPA